MSTLPWIPWKLLSQFKRLHWIRNLLSMNGVLSSLYFPFSKNVMEVLIWIGWCSNTYVGRYISSTEYAGARTGYIDWTFGISFAWMRTAVLHYVDSSKSGLQALVMYQRKYLMLTPIEWRHSTLVTRYVHPFIVALASLHTLHVHNRQISLSSSTFCHDEPHLQSESVS